MTSVRRLAVAFLLAFAMTGTASAQQRALVLVPQTTIADAVSGVVGDTILIPAGTKNLAVQARFLYGSGGTTAKAWVQTSLDNGATWIDVMNFAFTTAAATKVSAVNTTTALAAGATPTDGSLADNTILSGFLGDRIRVKFTTTGTYGGATSLKITAVVN